MANDSVDYLTTAGSAIAGTPAGGSTRSSHRFPLDLKSDSQGHFMTITAYPSQSRFSNNKDKSPTAISLFIPGGGQNSSLFWQMAHEYDEVKLTRLGTSVIGGIPVIGTATAAHFALSGNTITYSGPNEWSYRRRCLSLHPHVQIHLCTRRSCLYIVSHNGHFVSSRQLGNGQQQHLDWV